jgi:HAD superfamily hydrolase (TIGR01662 family)
MKGVIFDLDQTLVDSSISESYRNNRNWKKVFDLIPQFKIYNGIREFIDELQVKGYKIAIVTTSPSKYAEIVLNEFNIQYQFKVCYHDVLRRKPFPDQYLRVIQQLDLTLVNTYAFGDRYIDIQAAHSANIISCACFWGTNESDLLDKSNPTLKFNSVFEARDYFRNL